MAERSPRRGAGEDRVRGRREAWARPSAGVLLSLAPLVLWPLYCLTHGERRWELALLLVAIPALALGTPAMRKLYAGLYPLAVVGLVYDAMRFAKQLGLRSASVHVCDLRQLDARLFGVEVGGVRTTVHDVLQAHATIGLDLLCAVPYATYIFAAVGCAIYLYRRDYRAFQRFTWTFMVVNLAGFVTYHIYPAAPPWYFHTHGCAIDLDVAPSPGPNLTRVDALLGIHYFASLYGRSNDVFGAVPSLHVSYPLIILLEGYRLFGRPLRAAAVAFFVTMCFAAVYLDHHWVFDVALGLTYTLASSFAVRAGFRRLTEARGLTAAPATSPASAPGGSPGGAIALVASSGPTTDAAVSRSGR
jgi:inositol phosphorylceramide synthase catalytic subunit